MERGFLGGGTDMLNEKNTKDLNAFGGYYGHARKWLLAQRAFFAYAMMRRCRYLRAASGLPRRAMSLRGTRRTAS